jgi:hypothetical protein
MTWIRSPVYDCFWILNAPVLGLLMLLPLVVPLPTRAITAGLLCINFAHALAPIVLAWMHKGFRGVMLERPAKFVGGPALVIAAGVVAAVATWTLFPDFKLGPMALENVRLDNLDVPIVLWANLYAVWNLYHFGAQNFGLLCLYRRRGFKGRQKAIVLATCVAVTVFLGHEAARLFGVVGTMLFLMGLVTVNHWFAAIGLVAHVHARHSGRSPLWFVATVLVVGTGLVLAFYAALLSSVHAAMMALCLRGALGIWHFLQDRWIWKLSDPRVRATIGRDIQEKWESGEHLYAILRR